MHLKVFAALALCVAAAGEARAETIGAFVQGYGSMAGETDALMSGGSTSGMGGGVGLRGGVHLGPFSGYYDRTSFFHGSSASRAILAFGGDIPAGPIHIVLELGGGEVWENQGGVDGDMTQGARNGLCGRATVGIEAPIVAHLSFGVAFTDEYYAVHDTGVAITMPSDVSSGSDFLGTAYLKLAFGL